MIKKSVSIILLLSLVLAVSAFSAEALDDMPDKPDELSIIATDIDVDQYVQIGADNFEEEYGIEVNIMSFAYGDLWDQIVTSIAGGEVFDLYQMSNSWHPELGEYGMAVALDEIVSEEELDEITDRYFDVSIEFLTSGGHLWALPGNVSTLVFFYNEAMLNELGYDYAPETWDEMIDISREAIDEGLAEHGFFPGWLAAHEDGMVWFDIMLKLHDGNWINEEQTEWTFHEEEGVKALTLMKELLNEGIVPEASLEVSDWDNYHMFLSGQTPFEINWNFVLELADDPDASDIIGDYGVDHIPGIERDTYTVLGGGGYGISPTTRSEEWAFKLTDYLHRAEPQANLLKALDGAEATVKDLYENPEDHTISREENPLMDMYEQQLGYGGLRPSDYLTWYSEFRDEIFTPAMHRALMGEQGIEEALNEAYEEAQQLLEQRGL